MRRRSDFEHLAPIGSQGASQDVLGWSRMLPRLPNMPQNGYKMAPQLHRPTQLLTIAPRWHYDGPRRANMAQRWPTWARGGQRWLQDIAPNYFSHDLNGFKTYARWFQIASCLPNMAQDDTKMVQGGSNGSIQGLGLIVILIESWSPRNTGPETLKIL